MKVIVQVGKCEVPVRKANKPRLHYFSAGAHGKHEAGVYAFWTVLLREGKRRRIWGRALVGLSAGDRFDRMRKEMRSATGIETRAAYRRMWKALQGGKSIKYIRPSTKREVKLWMESHQKDARFASPMRTPR